jgi:hypothetical protein
MRWELGGNNKVRGTLVMGRLRILSALTVGLLLGLVAITILGGVAFGAIVGLRLEAEDMSEFSSSISEQSGPAGSNLRWASGAGVSARASQSNVMVPTGTTVNQIQVFTRQASGGNAVFAIYVDGTAAANKVGTFSPPAGSTWGTRMVNFSTAIQGGPQPHTIYIGPNATLPNNAFIDWFELHNTAPPPGGDTTPPDTSITSGPAEGSTDTDGSVSFGFLGTDNAGPVTRFECSLEAQGQLPNWSPCTSATSYPDRTNGSYTFSVRAIDAANNVDGTPATRNFSVSTTLPPPTPSGFNPGYGKGSAADCTRTLSAGGNVETFLNSLRPGERGCLRGGVYTADNSISVNVSGTSASPIILAAYPGERAEIRASFRANSSSYIELEGLYVDASYAPLTFENNRINTEQTVNLLSSSSWLLDSVELVNRRTPDNAGTCVFGGTSRNARITYSWVHQCGELPRTNREHGVYVANSTGMLIEHSWFSDIADRAISYHSNVVGAHANGVVVDSRNGAPAFLIGATRDTITENSVAYVTGDKSVNVGPAGGGSGNIFRNNCWNKPADAAAGVSYSNILIATPTFGSYPPNFKVTGPSSCVAMLPATSPFRP